MFCTSKSCWAAISTPKSLQSLCNVYNFYMLVYYLGIGLQCGHLIKHNFRNMQHISTNMEIWRTEKLDFYTVTSGSGNKAGPAMLVDNLLNDEYSYN